MFDENKMKVTRSRREMLGLGIIFNYISESDRSASRWATQRNNKTNYY